MEQKNLNSLIRTW